MRHFSVLFLWFSLVLYGVLLLTPTPRATFVYSKFCVLLDVRLDSWLDNGDNRNNHIALRAMGCKVANQWAHFNPKHHVNHRDIVTSSRHILLFLPNLWLISVVQKCGNRQCGNGLRQCGNAAIRQCGNAAKLIFMRNRKCWCHCKFLGSVSRYTDGPDPPALFCLVF